ncbi:MAG: hypothetical protein U0270_13455 [Labilithrix sp.]
MNDDELEKRFRELRARDTACAPSFEKLTAQRPWRVSPMVVIAPALMMAAGVVLWCGVAQNAPASAPSGSLAEGVPSPRRPPARASTPAALPLDFLLESTPITVHLDSDPTEGLLP